MTSRRYNSLTQNGDAFSIFYQCFGKNAKTLREVSVGYIGTKTRRSTKSLRNISRKSSDDSQKTRNIQLLLLCFRLFVERRSCSSFQWRNKDERHTFQKTGCKRSIVACLFLLGCINNHNDLFGILWMIVCLVKGHFALFPPPPEFEMAIHILVGCLSCLFLWNWYIEVMS